MVSHSLNSACQAASWQKVKRCFMSILLGEWMDLFKVSPSWFLINQSVLTKLCAMLLFICFHFCFLASDLKIILESWETFFLSENSTKKFFVPIPTLPQRKVFFTKRGYVPNCNSVPSSKYNVFFLTYSWKGLVCDFLECSQTCNTHIHTLTPRTYTNHNGIFYKDGLILLFWKLPCSTHHGFLNVYASCLRYH